MHLQHKGLFKWIPSEIIFKKIYVNLKCGITLENKQLSIQELIFRTKSFQSYYNFKSSTSLSNTLNICVYIYLIIIIIMITLYLSVILFSIVCLILFPGSSFVLFLSVLSNLYLKFVMYDSVWIITHHELNKMVTESPGTETNNFKPLIQLPARKRKQKFASYAI